MSQQNQTAIDADTKSLLALAQEQVRQAKMRDDDRDYVTKHITDEKNTFDTVVLNFVNATKDNPDFGIKFMPGEQTMLYYRYGSFSYVFHPTGHLTLGYQADGTAHWEYVEYTATQHDLAIGSSGQIHTIEWYIGKREQGKMPNTKKLAVEFLQKMIKSQDGK